MTNLEWANRFAHVSAVKESCANNVKIASVEGGMGDWDIKLGDILASTDRAVAAIDKLKGVRKCRVWTPEGTDVTVSIEERPPLQVTPIRQRGWMMGPLPLWAEVAYAAVENQTNGVIAVTGNMLGIGVDVVSEPIFWTVKDGICVEIEGGRDAQGAGARHRGRAQRRGRGRVRVRHQRQVTARLAVGEGPHRQRPLRAG